MRFAIESAFSSEVGGMAIDYVIKEIYLTDIKKAICFMEVV